MANVIYGHFDSAGSLHKQIASLCSNTDSFCDQSRMMRLYAGAVAECLLDYEDWMDGLHSFFNTDKALKTSLNTQAWKQNDYDVKGFVLDQDTELGRALVRCYLDENIESSFLMLRNIRASLLSIVSDTDDIFWTALYDMACATLVTEQLVHTLCDQVIDICVGGEGWSLGDCIQGLGALAGKYHAKNLNQQSLGGSVEAVVAHDFETMIQIIMNEAMRLGMNDTIGAHTMVAANDTVHYAPVQKASAIDLIAEPLFKIFAVFDPELRSMQMAKATGRMMAVAAAGDAADMDSCVVTPLALSSLQGSYHHALSSAWIGR